LKGRDQSKHLGVDGKTDLREIGWESVECMQLAQDRDQCPALVNTVMNLTVL